MTTRRVTLLPTCGRVSQDVSGKIPDIRFKLHPQQPIAFFFQDYAVPYQNVSAEPGAVSR